MEPEQLKTFSFKLYPYHIKFLEKINDNQSLALRTHLDSIIRVNKKIQMKQQLDSIMFFISIGLIFIIIALLGDSFITIISTMIGVFILTYGLIGGVIDALQRTVR